MNAVPVTLPDTPLAAMLLTGAANLLPAGTCMFMALLGGNGVAPSRGGWLLGGTALALLAGWVAGLVMARHLAQWGEARGWPGIACVAAASGATVAAYIVLGVLATFILLLVAGA